MKKDNKRLNAIYDKTNGYCHICHKKIAFSNYGLNGAKGAWHIDHSIPRAKGGSDHLNNLYPACIPCNLYKKDSSNSTIRRVHGNKRAPFSKNKLERIKSENTAKGIVAGASIGLLLGPGGAFIGGLVGGIIGNDTSPKK